jgi:hypothetical protein
MEKANLAPRIMKALEFFNADGNGYESLRMVSFTYGIWQGGNLSCLSLFLFPALETLHALRLPSREQKSFLLLWCIAKGSGVSRKGVWVSI